MVLLLCGCCPCVMLLVCFCVLRSCVVLSLPRWGFRVVIVLDCSLLKSHVLLRNNDLVLRNHHCCFGIMIYHSYNKNNIILNIRFCIGSIPCCIRNHELVLCSLLCVTSFIRSILGSSVNTDQICKSPRLK